MIVFELILAGFGIFFLLITYIIRKADSGVQYMSNTKPVSFVTKRVKNGSSFLKDKAFDARLKCEDAAIKRLPEDLVTRLFQ